MKWCLPVLFLVLALSARAASLYWHNGDALAGELVGADALTISWKCEHFAEPVIIERSALRLLTYPRPTPPPKTASRDWMQSLTDATKPATSPMPVIEWMVRLRNGDCVIGSEPTIKATSLELNCPRHGKLSLRLDAVQSLARITGNVLGGPLGIASWSGDEFVQNGSSIISCLIGSTCTREVALPLKSIAKFRVRSSSDVPRFRFAPHGKDQSMPAIETWRQELVLVAGNRFASIKKLEDEDEPVALSLIWDRGAGRAEVLDASGKTVASLDNLPVVSAPLLNAQVMFECRGADLMIDQLSISDYSRPITELPKGLPRIQKIDGSFVESLAELDNDLSKIQEISWADEQSSDAAKFPPPTITFADGSAVTGIIQSMDAEAMQVKTAWSDTLVKCKTTDLQRIVFDSFPRPTIDQNAFDHLTIDKIRLRGHAEFNGGSEPQWRLDGARKAQPIKNPSKAEIVFSTKDAEPPAASAMLINDAGDAISGMFKGIDDTGVQFHSRLFSAQSLPHDHVHAIRLAPPQLEPVGFRDKGWTIAKGDSSKVEITRGDKPADDKVTLHAGGVFVHGAMPASGVMSFELRNPTDRGSIFGGVCVTLRDTLDAPGKKIGIAIYCAGSSVFVTADPTSRNSRSQRLPGGAKSVRVRIQYAPENLKVFINETQILQNDVAQRSDEGTGVSLRAHALWGNSVTPVMITNFMLRPDSGSIPLISVSESAKRDILTVPRARRQPLPTHALLATNGDLIRGRIEAATDKLLHFESRAEDMKVPLERVDSIVWLQKPSSPAGDKSQSNALKWPSAIDETHWVELRDGSQINLKDAVFQDNTITGTIALLGRCEIPRQLLSTLRWHRPAASASLLSYANWTLQPAPEPVLPDAGASSPLVGKAAPSFELPTLDGKKFSLKEAKGSVVIIDFWATWCGPCVASMPELISTVQQFHDKPVKLITLNQGEPANVVKQFIAMRKWELPVALDLAQDVAKKYGVEGIPHTVIVDGEGIIRWVNTGFKNDGGAALKAAIELALAPKP